MSAPYITGIQQIGIGVENAAHAAAYYKELLGMNTLVFDDTSEACLMTQYTGGQSYKRRALLTLNMQGGGGLELWQYINRKPEPPANKVQLGDLGIYASIIKCGDISAAHRVLKANDRATVSEILDDNEDQPFFWLIDAFQNTFKVKQFDEQFNGLKCATGGVLGAVIGVSNIDASLLLYNDVLGINQLEQIKDYLYTDPAGRKIPCKRVILQKSAGGNGAFGKLLGSIQIELVEITQRIPERIYNHRFWGDLGFIHLCFDVIDMDTLKRQSERYGYPFKVDSKDSFSMEKASGRFCYIEDPDGTLIELVETHRVPIFKKWNIFLNLKRRGLERPLADWQINLLGLSKVR